MGTRYRVHAFALRLVCTAIEHFNVSEEEFVTATVDDLDLLLKQKPLVAKVQKLCRDLSIAKTMPKAGSGKEYKMNALLWLQEYLKVVVKAGEKYKADGLLTGETLKSLNEKFDKIFALHGGPKRSALKFWKRSDQPADLSAAGLSIQPSSFHMELPTDVDQLHGEVFSTIPPTLASPAAADDFDVRSF